MYFFNMVLGSCFILIDDHRQNIKIESVEINGFQKGFLFNFEISQTFIYNEKKPQEVYYVFTNDFKMCVYEITFAIGDKIIKPKLRSNDSKESLDPNDDKLIQIKLGNLQPETIIKVILKLAFTGQVINEKTFFIKFPLDFYTSQKSIEYLDVEASNFLFQLQCDKYKISKFTTNVKNINYDEKMHFFSIENRIECNENEHFIFIELEVFDNITSHLFLTPTDQVDFNGCAITFLPNFTHLTDEKNHEFVFAVDCSGSMLERSIEKASECLLFFIKSLPPNSYFNVVRFGSEHEKLFEKSVAYNDENAEKAINFAKKLKADLCGTNYYSALESIFKEENCHGQRQIFIITDGLLDRSDENACIEKVLELVSSNSKNNRCFTICVGPGCNEDFVEKISHSSGGKSEFVLEGESISEKVIQQLQSSFYPLLTSVEIHIKNEDKNDLFEISPYPIPSIDLNEPTVIYLREKKMMMNENLFKNGIFISGLYGKKHIEFTIEKVEQLVNAEEDIYGCSKGKNIGKCIIPLFAFQQLQKIERKEKNSDEDKFKAIEMSLSSGVLCKYTEYTEMIQNPIRQNTYKIINILREDRQMINHIDEIRNFETYEVNLICKKKDEVKKKSWFENFFDFLFRRSDTSNQPTTKQQNSPPEMISIKNDDNANEKYDLITIIKYQKVDGYWEDLKAVQSLIGLKIDNIDEINIKNIIVKKNCIATIIAIAAIRNKSASEKKSWFLIEIKALSWLKMILGEEYDINNLISKFESLF